MSLSHRLSVLALATLGSGAAHCQTTFEAELLYTAGGSAQFGDQIKSGDVNGDGILDLAIADTEIDLEGRVWIFHGPDFDTPVPVFIPNPGYFDALGFISGFELVDVNADQLPDLLVGGSSAGGPFIKAGRALLSYAPDFQTTIDLQNPSSDPTVAGQFGQSMAAYDYTGDGLVDILVGSPFWHEWLSPTSVLCGRINVYSGATGFIGPSAVGLTTPPIFPGPGFNGYGGCLVPTDLDGNSSRDIITSYKQVGSGGYGFAVLHDGDPANFTVFNNFPSTLTSPYANTLFVDVTGDGHREIVSGKIGATDGGVLVVYGPDFANSLVLDTEQSGDFGRGLDVGDVNRDGINDILIGEPEYDLPEEADVGQFFIYYGPTFTTVQSFLGAHAHAKFGTGIHLVDQDGNGFPEIFVGAGNQFGGALYRYTHRTLVNTGQENVSMSTGGSVPLLMDIGKLGASRDYLILVSASGGSPGLDIPVGGNNVHLPLNFDAATSVLIPFANGQLFQNFSGTTGGLGKAAATFVVPADVGDPILAGTTLTFAAVVAGPSGGIAYATDAAEVTLQP